MTRFVPPGAGAWRRDESHVDGVLTGYLDAVLTPAQQAGFAEGFAAVGAMLAGFDMARVAGHVYMRPIIVGAPKLPIWGDQPPARIKPPGKAPPKLVFKLLFLLHPELRRRAKRAAEVWEQKTWREVARRWSEELRPAAVRACRALARTDVAALDDAALATHVEEATRQFRELTLVHFRHAPVQTVVVGDFLVRAMAWTGASASDVLGALRGASPASRAGATETARIARALRKEPALRAVVMSAESAGAIVAALRDAPGEVGLATREYLEVHGLRPFTGLDLDAQTLEELPELVVRSLRAALAGGDGSERGHDVERDEALASLRARTPAEHRVELDLACAEATAIYGVRDDDVGIMLWALGILRRALLEAGGRLRGRGLVHDATDVLDALPDELLGLVRDGRGPSADALRARAARRREQDAMSPPVELGDPSPPPPPEHFPPAVARMQRAVFAFIGALDGEAQAPSAAAAGNEVQGVGVSAGVYEGRARVVRGVEDFARIEAGDVLVAPFTSPSYNVLLPVLGAIVTERGGLLSHAAIVAREYGIPGVVNARGAMERIPDGSLVRLDGLTGTVVVIGKTAAAVARAGAGAGAGASAGASAGVIPRRAPATEGRIVPLRDATDHDFGGKARALAAALGAQLPVPDGIALDADLVERVVAGEPAARRRVHDAIARVKGPWAVRSSAIGEDSVAASFAGQHTTVLGVNEAELFDAIARVRDSAHTASALAYRARMGISGAPRMGIVVQPLLCPDVSGVLFSRDPHASREGRVIEATWGLGEALVSGLVTPDRYRVGPDGKLLERAIAEKDVAIEPGAGGGTAEVSITGERVRAACLDERRLAELAHLASRCEQLFGGPQDLEWAISGDRLHLLQSRPVTAVP